MYQAVKEASIDDLEDFLDLPNADINMLWVSTFRYSLYIKCEPMNSMEQSVTTFSSNGRQFNSLMTFLSGKSY